MKMKMFLRIVLLILAIFSAFAMAWSILNIDAIAEKLGWSPDAVIILLGVVGPVGGVALGVCMVLLWPIMEMVERRENE